MICSIVPGVWEPLAPSGVPWLPSKESGCTFEEKHMSPLPTVLLSAPQGIRPRCFVRGTLGCRVPADFQIHPGCPQSPKKRTPWTQGLTFYTARPVTPGHLAEALPGLQPEQNSPLL